MSLPSDLLSQAEHLAKLEPRRPRQASLRRSVSSSYYALFHFIGEESAKILLGGSPAQKPLRSLARRAIAHAKLKDVCAEFAKPTPKASILKTFWDATAGIDPYQIAGDGNLGIVCRTLPFLQNARHRADYDFSTDLTKQDALDAHEQAREAIDAWNRAVAEKPMALKLFATAVLLWPGLSGRG